MPTRKHLKRYCTSWRRLGRLNSGNAEEPHLQSMEICTYFEEINLNVAKQTKTDMAGTLEKPCSGNLSNAKHPVSQTLLDFTLGEVLYNPFYVNNTRITRLCLPAGRQGSVPAGSAESTVRLMLSLFGSNLPPIRAHTVTIEPEQADEYKISGKHDS